MTITSKPRSKRTKPKLDALLAVVPFNPTAPFGYPGQASELGPCPGCGEVLVIEDVCQRKRIAVGLVHPHPRCDYFRQTKIDAITRAVVVARGRSK